MIRGIEYVILTYNNRTATMRLHQSLNRLGVRNAIVPTPNQISSSCGLSIKLKYVYFDKVMYCVKLNNLSVNYLLFGEQNYDYY